MRFDKTDFASVRTTAIFSSLGCAVNEGRLVVVSPGLPIGLPSSAPEISAAPPILRRGTRCDEEM